MCGIVGYIGKKQAYPILIKGLKRLEYRGYDSAGVALVSDSKQLNVYKTKGKVADLEAFVAHKDVSGTVGIAHVRSMHILITLQQRNLHSFITALSKTMPR